MPIDLPADGSTGWGDEVRAAIARVNAHDANPARQLTAEQLTAGLVKGTRWATAGDQSQPLAETTTPLFQPVTALGSGAIVVDPTQRFQAFYGVGAALTEASAYCLMNYLTAEQRAELLDELFNPARCGWTTLRIGIGATDFQSEEIYSYDDMPAGQTDPNLVNFSVEKDARYLIPLLQQIRKIQPNLKIFAACWYLPAWMKASGTLRGGTAPTTRYSEYRNYLMKSLDAFAAYDIPIYALSPQNEPFDVTGSGNNWTYWTPAQLATFIGNYLGPTLDTSGHETKIMAGDHHWYFYADVKTLLADATANPFIGCIGWHAYAGTPGQQIFARRVDETLEHHVTEIRTLLTQDWAESMRLMAGDVAVGSIRNYGSSVTLWNMFLDQAGNPTQTAPGRRGVVTVRSDAPGTVERNAEYYVLTHLAKAARPGAVRCASTTSAVGINGQDVESVAFINRDGSVGLFLYNPAATAKTFMVVDARSNRGIPVTMGAGELTTLRWEASTVPVGTPATITAPGAPTLTATGGTGQTVLSWTVPTSQARISTYTIRRATGAGAFADVMTLPASQTTWTDMPGAGGTYRYTVVANSAGGAGATSAEASTTLAALAAPAAPVVTASGGNALVVLSWAAVAPNGSPVTGYAVRRSTSPGAGAGAAVLATVAKGYTGYSDTGAANGTTYYYTVTAINATGSTSSSEVSAAPAAPTVSPTVGTVTTGTTGSTPAAALAFSHPTPTADNRLLLVAVEGGAATANASITGVTYGGVALTRVQQVSTATPQRLADLWFLEDPPVGSAQVEIIAAGVANLSAHALPLAGAALVSATFGTPVSAATTATTTPSVATTGGAATDLVVAVAGVRSAAAITPGAGQTVQGAQLLAGTNARGVVTTQAGGTGTVTSSFTLPAADSAAIVAVAVKAA